MRGRESKDIPRQFGFTVTFFENWLKSVLEDLDKMDREALLDDKRRLDAMEVRLPTLEKDAKTDFDKEMFAGLVKHFNLVKRKLEERLSLF